MAVYSKALRIADVQDHFAAGGGNVQNLAPGVLHQVPQGAAELTVRRHRRTDPDGAIAGYAWNFGDGTTSTEAKPVHTYAAPGRTRCRSR